MSEFLEKQQQKLDDIISRIPASQQSMYSKRIREIQKSIKDKRQTVLRSIKKNKGKDLNTIIDTNGGHLYTNINKFVVPNINSIDKQVSDKAVLSRASTIFNRSGKSNTESYLKQNGLDYEILPESTDNALVVKDSNDNVKIAFRGTLLPQSVREVPKSIRDISLDFAYLTNTESKHPDFKKDDALVRDVNEKYNVDELVGFSLGGAKAQSFGEKYNIKTTSFNPLIGQSFIRSGASKVKHDIYRTTEDLPSSGTALINRENVKVNSVYPLSTYSTNPKRTHDLENFISSGQRVKESNIKRLTDLSVDKGQRVSEYALLDDMLDSKGTFSDWLHKYNKGSNGVDTDRNGRLLEDSVRATNKTVHGKLWKRTGRDFTDSELEVFKKRDLPEQEHTLTDSEIDTYIHSDKAGRKQIFDSSLDSLQNVHEDLSEAMSSPIDIRQGGIDRSASLLTGLISGKIAQKGVSSIESLTGRKLTDTQKTVAQGGLAGTIQDIGVASLSGSNLSLSSPLIGAGSAFIGQKTEELAKPYGSKLETQTLGGVASGLSGAVLGGIVAGMPLDFETLGGSSIVGGAISGLSYGLHQLGVNI